MPLNIFGFTFSRTPTAPAPNTPERERARDDYSETGSSGTVYYSGFLDGEEYNADLRGQKGIDAYTKMRADGMVKGILRALTLPMRTATLKLEPASDDEQDQYIARATEYALMNMPGITHDDFRRQSFMGAYTYGHSVFEQVYASPDGVPNVVDFEGTQVLMPWKLAPRLQKSIYRWHIDKFGELKGVQQRVFQGTMDADVKVETGETQGGTNYLNAGTYKYIDIGADRLVVFSFDQEGANYMGESVLRSAYKHHFYKDAILRIMAIGIERHLVGVPYAILKQNVAPNEKAAVIEALATLRSHEKGYFVGNVAQLASPTDLGMPPLGFLEMPTLGGNGRLADQAIQYHDRQMALSILADFLSLGSGLGGNANVMSRDKTSYFFLALEGYAQAWTDALERQFVRRFVQLNWPGVTAHPTVRLMGLEAKDLDRIGRGLSQLIQVGGITADAEVQNQLRELFGLPLLPEDADGNPILPDPPQPEPMPQPDNQQFLSERKPQGAERHVNFAQMERDLDAAVVAFKAAATDNANAIATRIVEGRSVVAPSQRELAETLAPTLRRLYHKGRAHVMAERRRAAGKRTLASPPRLPRSNANDDGGILKLAEAMADRIVGRLTDWWARVKGDVDVEDLEDEQAAAVEAAIQAVGRYGASVPLNQGRQDAAAQLSDEIAGATWSSLLDKESCEYCTDQDGEEFTLDDAPDLPDGNCEGGDNCRCVIVYTFKTEAQLTEPVAPDIWRIERPDGSYSRIVREVSA